MYLHIYRYIHDIYFGTQSIKMKNTSSPVWATWIPRSKCLTYSDGRYWAMVQTHFKCGFCGVFLGFIFQGREAIRKEL